MEIIKSCMSNTNETSLLLSAGDKIFLINMLETYITDMENAVSAGKIIDESEMNTCKQWLSKLR